MATLDTKYICLYSQLSADAVLGKNDPAKQSLNTYGFSKALESAANTDGFEQIQFSSALARPTSGSNRKVEVAIYKKECTSVTDGSIDVCTEDTAEGSKLVLDPVLVSQYKHRSVTIDKSAYRDLCEGTVNENIGRQIKYMAEDLIKARNTYLATTYEASTTTYFDGDDSSAGGGEEKQIKLFSAAAVPQPMAFFKLHQEYMSKGYTGTTPIVVGGIPLNGWIYSQPIYAGNVDGNDGLRLPDGVQMFVDYEVDTIAQAAASDTANRAWSFVPGHNQIVKWLDYGAGSPIAIRPGESTEGVKDTIEVMGHTFDFTVSNPFCSDNAVVSLGWGYDLFSIDSNYVASSCGAQLGNLSYQLTGAALTYAADIVG